MDERRSARRVGGRRAGRDGQPVPPATVARLPGYLRALQATAAEGAVLTSSDELAARAGVSPAQLRKDLSFLGSYGRRGVGYDVAHLREQITVVLGLADVRRVLLVGVGNLGHALANYAGIAERGFVLVGLVDADPAVVGTTVAGLVVEHADDLRAVVARTGATIAVLTTPASVAQRTCDELVAAGVVGILTFAPGALRVPDHVDVRTVDVASELQILAFHDRARSAGGGVS
ncbi:CoA-binding domain protein [Cellulomonas flavigena DSM 20109]|uniref:Redox-sensing transcriptional repressor Rex n=1 Tax=Cellulomonas flavigena (strain ATCC 482 / DSM 20109 / BCRC 11376 / JCM 18109 / NBRC 3775 / NCIMB 8073 / NRS 134) TaxID=446466 RepID=D5UJI6_CELFN|nr:redox-sensing transcriptional repressor Rex [Cellulomonas flavigena]ADG75624.1 CoA-binding domain protein [Cellulomonas flavigena DSM 20109]